MKNLLIFFVVFSLTSSSFALAASSEVDDLQRQLQQKEDRIERLEREVEYLQNQLMDLQNNSQTSVGGSRAMDRNVVDPLVGAWECTNKVYNYDISFFADGRLFQEEPFFSKVKSTYWSRLDENRFFIEQGGPTFITEFQTNDALIITNPANKVVWECSRK